MKRALSITLVLLLILSSILIPILHTTGNEIKDYEYRPLMVWKAHVVPTIDGIISLGEWNDTDTYEYTRTSPPNISVRVQSALKYDEQSLYILFKVAGVQPEGFLTILTSPEDNETLLTSTAIAVFPNGTVKDSTLLKTGISIDWSSSLNAEAKSSYSNNESVFEIKLDKRYLDITHGYAPFNIEYTANETSEDYGLRTLSIGEMHYAGPGLLFLPCGHIINIGITEWRPLVAYEAQHIPRIDGIISPGEWDDTEVYTYTRNNSLIMNSSIKLQCALKYDKQWLYILFKVVVPHSGGYLTLNTLTSPEDNDLFTSTAIAVLPNGTVKDSTLLKTGIDINWSSSVNAEAKSTFSNNGYVFEIKLDKRYLDITNGYAPFNMEYTVCLYGWETVAIGDSRTARPGVVLYYEDQTNQESGSLYWYMSSAGIIAVVAIISLFFLRYKKSMSKEGKGMSEEKDNESEQEQNKRTS